MTGVLYSQPPPEESQRLGAFSPPAPGLWAEAWRVVFRRPGPLLSAMWLGVVGFFAAFAPIVSSGHPLLARAIDESGNHGPWTSPLARHLSATDWLFAGWGLAAVLTLALPGKTHRQARVPPLLGAAVQAAASVAIAAVARGVVAGPDLRGWARMLDSWTLYPLAACSAAAFLPAIAAILFVRPRSGWGHARIVVIALGSAGATFVSWQTPLASFPYRELERAGRLEAVYTLNPFSPFQRRTDLDMLPPGASFEQPALDACLPGSGESTVSSDELRQVCRCVGARLGLAEADAGRLMSEVERSLASHGAPWPRPFVSRALAEAVGPRFRLGTDSLGQDVLAQLLHAARLAITIGLVSTSIALLVGVSVGALMGFFGGWLDLALSRILEVFIAVPVLFLLVVSAAVLPRNTYVMMAVIGLFTWHGAARFTRAEFMRLRDAEFVQAARATGVPLQAVLFRHMLPNGVTPVLIDAGFGIAAAILAETTLSYLGLGPDDQASWGRLLGEATNQAGRFVWWIGVVPGIAVFLTAMAYNVIAEALRDAIDPRCNPRRTEGSDPRSGLS